MACEGFRGVMSCKCLDQCAAGMGVGSIKNKICFAAPGRATHSDVPANLSGTRFYARHRLLHIQSRGWADTGKRVSFPSWSRWGRAKELQPIQVRPLPNDNCPGACSHAGTCVGDSQGRQPHCVCHHGYNGTSCELSDYGHCLNKCSGHGRCVNRFCLCKAGWFGLDCSLTSLPARPTRWAPTYVYPLPTEWSSQFWYQNDPTRVGMFYTSKLFLELLHSRKDSIVADPDMASLFFVPLLPVHIGTNLWDPRQLFARVVRFISRKYPYWNRTQGADHVFFTTQVISCNSDSRVCC